MIEKIAETGVCNFECWYCKLNDWCNNHNYRNNDTHLDQNDLRKRFAAEYLANKELSKEYKQSMNANL